MQVDMPRENLDFCWFSFIFLSLREHKVLLYHRRTHTSMQSLLSKHAYEAVDEACWHQQIYFFFFLPDRTAKAVSEIFQSVKVLLCVSPCVISSLNMLLALLPSVHGGGRRHIACEKSWHKLMISFHFILFLQMLGEQFTPQHTSQKKWYSCSGVKVSLPSWLPSSRSPPRQESYSPSTSQNTGNPAVILFILAHGCFSV